MNFINRFIDYIGLAKKKPIYRSTLTIIGYCFDYIEKNDLSILFYNMAIKHYNDSFAYNELGKHYFKRGLINVYTKLLKKSISLGNVESIHDLAMYKKDKKLLKKAASLDYKDSMIELAKMYRDNNFKKLEKYLVKGIKLYGCRKCMFMLGYEFEKKNDILSATLYYNMAAKKHCILSLQRLSESYLSFDDDYDYKVICEYYQLSELGKRKFIHQYVWSLLNFRGKNYFTSDEVKKNYCLAIKYGVCDNSNLEIGLQLLVLSRCINLCDLKDFLFVESLYLKNINNNDILSKLSPFLCDVYSNNCMPLSEVKKDVYLRSFFEILMEAAEKKRNVFNQYYKRKKELELENNNINLILYNKYQINEKKYEDDIFEIEKKMDYKCRIRQIEIKMHYILNNIPPYKINDKLYDIIIIF